MEKIFASLLILVAVSSYCQVTSTTSADPDWADHQRIDERLAYWHSIEISGPDTNIVEARLKGYNQFISLSRSKSMMVQTVSAWEQVGGSQNQDLTHPANIQGTVSGRPTSIAFDKNTQIMYLGTSGGGLWKTTDGGNTWVSLSDSWSSYAMGGVALDYTDNKTLYAATGDLYDRTGDGLYKSTDAGLNWTHVVSQSVIGSRCNQVLIDPQVHTTIYVTGTSGVYRSLDAGVTWKKILSVSGIAHMVIDPTNGQNLYVGGAGEIKKSTDGGKTWSGDLAADIASKATITLAISNKDSSKIYASIGNDYNGGSLGLARSDDFGNSWSLVWSSDNYMSQQQRYDNACAVNPKNPNYVVVGGLDIWGSNDGGNTVHQRTDWTSGSSSNNFSHADIHVLSYNAQGNLYALTDGGIFLSTNNGTSWQQTRNSTLSTMLFVGGDAAPDFSYIIGGAQDNGINRALEQYKVFKQTHGGDGGHCFISQSDGQSVYSTYIYASLQKSGDYGNSWNFGPNSTDPYNMIPLNSPLLNENVPFYMNYDVSESDGSVVAIAGGTNVYYSYDGVNSLQKITGSSTISGGPVTVHCPAADPYVVYAGGGAGSVYVTKNAQDPPVTWTKSTTSIGVASDFTTDPNDASRVWASISGYGGKHFWRSTDYGKTWEAPATNLPNLDASSIARAPNGDLFLGHAFGVMRSLDNGVTWEALRDGMPLCQVTKLRVRGSSHQYLLATTYGRGMYRININLLPRTIIGSGVANLNSTVGLPAISSISPNPVHTNGRATIEFNIVREGNITLILYDELGREAKVLLKEFRNAGPQNAEVDVTSLNSGMYYAVLSSDGHAVTERFLIAK